MLPPTSFIIQLHPSAAAVNCIRENNKEEDFNSSVSNNKSSAFFPFLGFSFPGTSGSLSEQLIIFGL